MSSEERFRGCDRIEGSYDLETGDIILWNPKECDKEDLFLILTHEWGHKVYHEWLSDKARTTWLKIHTEERIDFQLEESYPSIKLPEEEFCTVFCIVSEKLYLKKVGAIMQAKKLTRRINESFPKAAAFVETQIRKPPQKKDFSRPRGRRDITQKEVQAIKAWIRSAIEH